MVKKIEYKLRRDAFLAAAGRAIRKKGLAGMTVRAVAREAGFTTGALVHYVQSIDRLLLDAEDYSAKALRVDMGASERLPDKLEALRQVIFLAMPLDEDSRGHWNFWIGFWERSVKNAAVRERMRSRYAEWMSRLERLIRNAQESGDIDESIDAEEAAKVCVALVDGIVTQTLRSGFPISPDAQRAIIDKWIVNWLKPTRPMKGARPARRNSRRAGSRAKPARAKAK